MSQQLIYYTNTNQHFFTFSISNTRLNMLILPYFQQQQNHISIGELPLPSAIPQVHQKMAMIATVQPFKQQQHNGNGPKNRMKEEEQFNCRDSTDGFRIEDVTDDPKVGNGDWTK
jgi:hypothetical protein